MPTISAWLKHATCIHGWLIFTQTGKTREANLKHLIFMYYVFLIRDFYYTIRVV